MLLVDVHDEDLQQFLVHQAQEYFWHVQILLILPYLLHRLELSLQGKNMHGKIVGTRIDLEI